MSDRKREILDFWHRLEFFIPFDLQGRMSPSAEGAVQLIPRDDPAALLRPPQKDGYEISFRRLYLCPFDRSIVADLLPRPEGGLTQLDEQERSEPEGLTCFASLRLTPEGAPDFSGVEVSTLPWAIGRLRQGGLDAIAAADFSDARAALTLKLAQFASQRRNDDDPNPALTDTELVEFYHLLCDWAGFAPADNQPLAVQEVLFRKSRKQDESTDQISDDEDDPTPEIGILNSFYIEDLERAQKALADGRGRVLAEYLTPGDSARRVDLYSDAGRALIVDMLHPAQMNRGRWLSPPEHGMSLMQQFAINAIFDRLKDGGIYAVNGPPGTGKTTLLRDILAENITSRARVLAGLHRASDAFAENLTGRIGDKGVTIARLIPELTGYEMVVASSNNAAVENISRELPQSRAIMGNTLYLQPVAHRLAARKKDGSFRKLDQGDMPWGLISAALGKKENRKALCVALFGHPLKESDKQEWSGDPPQTVWQWRNTYDGPDFTTAKAEFIAADRAVEDAMALRAEYADLTLRLQGQTREGHCAAAQQQQDMAQADYDRGARDLDEVEKRTQAARTQVEHLREAERLIDRTAPSFWSRLTNRAGWRDYVAERDGNAKAQLAAHRAVGQVQREREVSARALADAERRLMTSRRTHADAASEWDRMHKRLAELAKAAGHPRLPDNLSDLESDTFQIAGLWHDPEIAALRSELFARALALHQAWLADVAASRGGFGQTLFALQALLDHGSSDDPGLLLAAWQALFMVVPVVSSTFASVSRQFGGLGPDSIGWLFVDEAGQAAPQQAVGALMRARRAVIIGDPLQIEPVFTVPSVLTERLATMYEATKAGDYAPDLVSAQMLADRAVLFGANLVRPDQESLWIGSPLRVHRRCFDPMFSIANDIAYQGRMVHGMKHRDDPDPVTPDWGDSGSIDLPGKVQGKQVVPDQVAFVAELVIRSYNADGRLPALFIISPFREVRDAISAALHRPENWTRYAAEIPKSSVLKQWITSSVGTVHTFQGKEQDSVLFVLGTDADTKGAAQWAASKPNILNVALTRAKRRFWLLGDYQLWAGLPYFSRAADLPRKSPDDLRERLAR